MKYEAIATNDSEYRQRWIATVQSDPNRARDSEAAALRHAKAMASVIRAAKRIVATGLKRDRDADAWVGVEGKAPEEYARYNRSLDAHRRAFEAFYAAVARLEKLEKRR